MPTPQKKVAAFALAGLLMFGVAACDDGDGTEDTTIIDDGTDATDAPMTDAPVPEDDGSVFDDTTAPVDG